MSATASSDPNADPAPAKTPGERAFLFVFITVAIDMIGIGLIIPVWPELLSEMLGGDPPAWAGVFEPLGRLLAAVFGAETGVPAMGVAAAWGGLITTVYAMMQFVFSPILGALSDRFGRRPVLLLSLLTLGVDYVIMGFAGTIWLLFFSRALSGACAATYATANAFVADISPKEKRAARFGLLGAAFGIGFVLGPALGGLLGDIDPRAPFFAAAGLAFLNVAYGYFVLPETLPKAKRRAFTWARANAFGAFAQMRRVPEVAGLLIIVVILQLASMVYPATWSYFTIEKFGWSTSQVGASLAFYGVIFGLSQAVIIRFLIKGLGPVRTILLSMTASAVILVGIATAATGAILYFWMSLALLSGASMPALQSMMTNRVRDDAQGELQGLIASMNGIVMIVSPLLMTQTFRSFTTGEGPYFPGAPYLLAAGFVGVGLVAFSLIMLADKAAGGDAGAGAGEGGRA